MYLTRLLRCLPNSTVVEIPGISGKLFANAWHAIALISVVALGGGKILGHWGLELLYGDEVAAHEDLLLPLIGCTILTAIVWFLCALLTVVRRDQRTGDLQCDHTSGQLFRRLSADPPVWDAGRKYFPGGELSDRDRRTLDLAVTESQTEGETTYGKIRKSACFRHFFDRKKSILEAKV